MSLDLTGPCLFSYSVCSCIYQRVAGFCSHALLEASAVAILVWL